MFKRNWKIISLAVAAAVFFVVYLYLYLPTAPKYPEYLILNQPDESVNYFFVRDLAINHRFVEPEPFASWTGSQVHPRSTTVVYGNLVPIGFPGMIVISGTLLGLLVKIFGVGHFNFLAVMLTPFLAAVTPLFFYGFLRRVWNEKAAWLSSALLFFLPPWWYYASRPFQHNTLLVFLVTVGLYCYAHSFTPTRKVFESCHSERQRGILSLIFKRFLTSLRFVRNDKLVATFSAGLFFGLAVYVRPSEIVWLAGLGAVGLIAARKVWNWREYFACGVGLALTAILFFATQTVFYGHPLGSGYVRPTLDGAAGIVTAGPQGIGLAQAIFLPFGFHPLNILRNVWAYFFKLFGVWTILAGAGVCVLVWRLSRHPREACPRAASGSGDPVNKLKSDFAGFPIKSGMTYMVAFFLVSIFLLIFYGSWTFYDNLLRAPSIGTSYVRYFLLIYVFGLPFLSIFLLWLWQKKLIFKIAAVIFFLALLVNSLGAVFAPLEGLSMVKATVTKYGEWRNKIDFLTENYAVIVTRYADKYIFPERRVIPGWTLTEQKNAIITFASDRPVYLYDLKLSALEEKEWQSFLEPAKLKLSASLANWENLELRKIER